jgi:hypothetical protein
MHKEITHEEVKLHILLGAQEDIELLRMINGFPMSGVWRDLRNEYLNEEGSAHYKFRFKE